MNEEIITKDKEEEKQYWKLLVGIGVILFIIGIIGFSDDSNSNEYYSDQTDSNNEFYSFCIVGGILAFAIGFTKVWGNPFKSASKFDLHDGILAYGTYKYLTHKKKGKRSKLSEFTKENPILVGAMAYSGYKKISQINEELKESKNKSEIEIIDDLKKDNSKEIIEILKSTTITKKDQLIKEINTKYNVKIISLQPLKLEVGFSDVSKITDILNNKKIKFKKIKIGEKNESSL